MILFRLSPASEEETGVEPGQASSGHPLISPYVPRKFRTINTCSLEELGSREVGQQGGQGAGRGLVSSFGPAPCSQGLPSLHRKSPAQDDNIRI